jgi:putative endonuclease
MGRSYFVYILASRSRNLYVGVTGDLERRMVEHRQGLVRGFTTRYKIFRLVYVELFGNVRYAITREKAIKGWSREKKVSLIEWHNRSWEDLAGTIGHKYVTQDGAKSKATAGKATADPSPPFAESRRPGSG